MGPPIQTVIVASRHMHCLSLSNRNPSAGESEPSFMTESFRDHPIGFAILMLVGHVATAEEWMTGQALSRLVHRRHHHPRPCQPDPISCRFTSGVKEGLSTNRVTNSYPLEIMMARSCRQGGGLERYKRGLLLTSMLSFSFSFFITSLVFRSKPRIFLKTLFTLSDTFDNYLDTWYCLHIT